MRKAVFAMLLAISLTGCHANPKYVCAPPEPAACPLPLCPAAQLQPVSDLRNLALEGGGVKGLAYPGALQVLQAEGILPKIEQVAGTSAGSIVAALVALGYSPEEMQALMLDLDFKQFEDGSTLGGPGRLFRKFGWFKGDYFLEWMQCRVKEQTGNPDATFADLHNGRPKLKDLFVVSSDLSRRRSQVFSNDHFHNNPDDRKRTIQIDDLGVGTTDFSLSNEMKCKLIQQGVIDACKYLGGLQPLH